ncbi:MAG: hypothetical protein LBU87_07015 [Lactobacillales bacterium]|jgi:type IV secretory pathway component VirB8|nr:hypothetical protein [Lactobacillales bacterium]
MDLFRFFRKHRDDSPDVLEVYPEKVQVPAIPERRYLRTSRLLAAFILLNIAVMIALGGFYIYITDRVNVSIANPRVVNLFAMDVEQKVIKPAEHGQARVNSLRLMIESIVEKYVVARHSIVWNNDIMTGRINRESFLAAHSTNEVFEPLQREMMNAVAESRASGYVRDVHLYEIRLVGPDLWQAIIDTFDMPVPDSFRPICGNCMTNDIDCLTCKEQNAFRRRRFKVYLKTNFAGQKTLANPLGILVYSYSLLYMPIHKDENFWDIPAALRPKF